MRWAKTTIDGGAITLCADFLKSYDVNHQMLLIIKNEYAPIQ